MTRLHRLYQYINILSLDVVAGAVTGALFFGKLLQVPVDPLVLAALALTVWVIYTLDHLRDAMTIPRIASADRHRFHQSHFRLMVAVVVIVGAVDLIIIGFLSYEVLRAGMALGLIVLLYLITQRYLKFLKEFFVACLYTAGILLPSIVNNQAHLSPEHLIVIGKYFVTALMNLLLFSLFDFNTDRHQQQHSFVTWFGPRFTSYGIIVLGMVNILSGIWLWGYDAKVAAVFVCMNLVLLAVLFLRNRLVSDNYYRIIGDAVFFIPLFYLL